MSNCVVVKLALEIPAFHSVFIHNNYLLSGQSTLSLINDELERFVLTSLFRTHERIANDTIRAWALCYRLLSIFISL